MFLRGLRIHEAIGTAEKDLATLASLGIDLSQVTRELEEEGVDKFAKSFDGVLAGVEEKARALAATGGGD